ncbi:MAG: beta-galactosidase trimerization domain-containing protein [Bacteroidales bacterium]|nr:beta-galactosidase trimerization domain-containing protein [Bacteroidales bacterium]
MEKKYEPINRRSFIRTTGTALTGFTLIPFDIAEGNLKAQSSHLSGYGLTGNKMTGEKWWEREPLRIVELEQGFEYGEKADLLNDLGANMEHLVRFTDTSPGTSFLDAHNLFGGKKVNYSSLKEYLAEAHKRNIKVIIYFNVHAIEISYARQHPEWQQIKDDGKPIEDVYSVDSSFCINSPWREEVFITLRKLAAYEIDGIFYDGPIFFSATCHCAHCRKLYNEKYSSEIPSKTALSAKRDNPSWKKLLEFQSDSIARFLRDSNRILKDINPQILFYMNGNTLAPSWPTGRDNRKIIAETDVLGAEGGFLYGALSEPIYKPGAVAKLLETQSGGKPTVVFDAAKQGPWTFSKLPAGEISILYSQTITYQGNVWLAVSINPSLHKKEMDVIRSYNGFIKEHQAAFLGTESLSRIALLWPQDAGNFYDGSSVPLTDFTREMKTETAGNLEEEFYGFYDGLSRVHCPFDVIDEEALNKGIEKYDLIILPNATCLTKEASEKIKDFVKQGGNILSTFETSFYNETGKKLDNPLLSDLFGINETREVFGPLAWDYVTPGDTGNFSLKEINQQFIYAPEYGLKVKTGSAVPLYFCKPLPGSYSGSPELSEFPFIVDNSYGKGKSIYMAGTFGSSLYKFHFPEYYQLLSNILLRFSTPLVRLDNVPSSVEVSLRKGVNSIFLYLINFTSEMKRPIQKIIPCQNLKIELLLQEKVKSVNALWSGKTLDHSVSDHSISFILPLIEDYEVIEIKI